VCVCVCMCVCVWAVERGVYSHNTRAFGFILHGVADWSV
jgi:hypothetical protein